MSENTARFILFDHDLSSATFVRKPFKGYLQALDAELAYGGGKNREFQRKFLVFFSKDKKDLLLVVGPVFCRKTKEKFYFHKDLLRASASSVPEGFSLSGGGEIVFLAGVRKQPVQWTGSLEDYSGSYGIYDPRVLEFRKAITRRFGIPMRYLWEYPYGKKL